HFFCIVVKGGAAEWSASRSQCRMEARGGRAAWRRGPRGQPHFCLATERLCGPPVGGLFGFKSSSRRHPRKFGVKRFLVVREVAGAEVGWPVLGYLLWKKLSAA